MEGTLQEVASPSGENDCEEEPHQMVMVQTNITMAHMQQEIIQSLMAGDALFSEGLAITAVVGLFDDTIVSGSNSASDDKCSTEPLPSIVAPGVIVFSYSTLPSILINLIVSSPPSETEAWPNDWSSTTSGARFAHRSYPNVNGPCSSKRSELMNETIWLNEFDSQGTFNNSPNS